VHLVEVTTRGGVQLSRATNSEFGSTCDSIGCPVDLVRRLYMRCELSVVEMRGRPLHARNGKCVEHRVSGKVNDDWVR